MKDRLVFVKTEGACCQYGFCCDIERLFGDCKETEQGEACDENYHFKLVEESEEIQSEYEWKKERFELLCRHCFDTDDPLSDEREELDIWLKGNPTEKWEVCTKENTKVGDEVRERSSIKAKRIVEYTDRHRDTAVLYNQQHKQVVYDAILANYEINVYKEEE